MRTAFALALACLVITPVSADEQTNEDRLRDALRQSVAQMRAAQDQAAQAQADLQKAQAAQQAVQAQLDAANAKLAAMPAKPAAPVADARAVQEALAAGRAQNAALQQGLAKWQAAYNEAATLARAKDAESRQSSAGLQADAHALQTCKAGNAKLVTVAEDILHLYQTQSFRSLLLRSYEPVIGTARVKLENLVQDYDDRIRNQEYIVPPQSAVR